MISDSLPPHVTPSPLAGEGWGGGCQRADISPVAHPHPSPPPSGGRGFIEAGGGTSIAELRALLARSAPGAGGALRPLGLPALDAALDGGLPTGCLQEVIAADEGAAAGFAAFLLARAAGNGRGILWASLGAGDLYPPGLAAFGLDPARLLLLAAPGPADLLWALEEALRCPALGAVLGEVERLDLTAGRRLQLAASAGGVTGFLLARRAREPASVSAAALRWRVASLPGGRWRVELLRRRGGRPGAWILEREDETHRLVVAAELADGSSRPAAADAG
jgi:protein ImuA